MAIKKHSCVSVACDVCGREFEGSYNEGVRHYETRAEALGDAEGVDWCVTTAGGAICDVEDDAHAQAVAQRHSAGMEPNHDCWRLVAAVDAEQATS